MLETTVKQWTQDWKQEGIAEGKAEGIAEGEQHEAVKILLRLLDKKFGPVNQELREIIQTAPLAQVEQWIDSIFQVSSAEALVRGTLTN